MSLQREYQPEEIKELENRTNEFHKALFEKTVDENIIVEILSNTTNEERQIIRSIYKKTYKHPIQNDINSQLTGKLREITIDMFDTPYEYDARELNKVLSQIGTDEDTIIEIFSTRPKNYLEIVDKAYKKFYKISLKDEIKNQFQKIFAEFLLTIMDYERPLEQSISGDEAYEIANDIIKNGYILYSSDVNLFKKVFVEKSREDLILISRAYYELEKKNLYDVFEEENIEQKSLFDEKEEEKKVRNKNIKLIKGLLFGVITPSEFFAKKCINALTGFSTDINTLSRILINRVEIDMFAIRDYYLKETKCELSKEIENTCKDNGEIGTILYNLSIQ